MSAGQPEIAQNSVQEKGAPNGAYPAEVDPAGREGAADPRGVHDGGVSDALVDGLGGGGPAGVPPVPNAAEGATGGVPQARATHFGLTVDDIEREELRSQGNEIDWQPFDEVKNLVWIKSNTVHSVALEDWDQKEKLLTDRFDRMQKMSGDSRNEIYQLVGFFLVFQGVVLTAVTQMTQAPEQKIASCKKVWSPVLLTGLAWIVTSVGVWQKLTRVYHFDKRCGEEDDSRREVVRWGREMRRLGKDFKFSELLKNQNRKEEVPPANPSWMVKYITDWLKNQGINYPSEFYSHRAIPVLGALSVFTGVFVASYFLILCDRGLAPIDV